ncbi:MAG TPA: tyrosine-type recombinase/integrase, partial [Allocoleopsis sp.]
AAIAQRKWQERDRLLWTLLLHGLRAEELVNLNVGDYDAAAGLMICTVQQRQGQDQQGQGQDQQVTTDRIPLAPQVAAEFNAYRVWREQREQRSLAADQPLFISFSPRSYGQRLTYWGIRQIIDQLAKATGIDLHANRGRQTFAARLILDLDFDPTLAMELTRHRDLRSLKPYIDRRNEQKKLDTKQIAKQAFLQAMSRSPQVEMEKIEMNSGKDEKNAGTVAPFD